ncbi:MAG: hypothetical protein DRJ67_11630 [Thermoprotei archaeon]|nr:MAG: hypothetical protein DRJ67_11630 [Thermoprotei archaeon]
MCNRELHEEPEEVMWMSQRELIYRHLSEPRSLLIVLDACRYDMFLENLYVLNGLKFRVFKVYSSGSCTKEWLEKTFTEPLDTVYVTANSWVTIVFRNWSPFKAIVDVSAKYWDRGLGTVRAEHVNLVALKYLIRGERLIVHYLQPHAPFVTKTWLVDRVSGARHASLEIYRLARKSRRVRREFRRAYIENLRYVLRHAKRLARMALRLGYRVAMTSDHSELLGDYTPLKVFKLYFSDKRRLLHPIYLARWLLYATGIRRVVGHPCGWRGKELYEVPWVEIYGGNREGVRPSPRRSGLRARQEVEAEEPATEKVWNLRGGEGVLLP